MSLFFIPYQYAAFEPPAACIRPHTAPPSGQVDVFLGSSRHTSHHVDAAAHCTEGYGRRDDLLSWWNALLSLMTAPSAPPPWHYFGDLAERYAAFHSFLCVCVCVWEGGVFCTGQGFHVFHSHASIKFFAMNI